MNIDYQENGKIKISMIDYIQDMLDDLPEDMNGEATTPAGDHLFTVNTQNPKLLDKADAETFHHNVAKLLFLCKRAQPDIQTAVAFLCTRVCEPDEDNWKKLVQMIS